MNREPYDDDPENSYSLTDEIAKRISNGTNIWEKQKLLKCRLRQYLSVIEYCLKSKSFLQNEIDVVNYFDSVPSWDFPSMIRKYKNVYVARRQGTRSTSGAIIVLNNNDTDTLSINLSVNSQGFKDLSDTQLVDAFSPTNKVKVSKDGRVTFIVQPRGFSIWVKENEL